MASNSEEIIQYHIFLKNIVKSTNPQDSTESLLLKSTNTTTTSSMNNTTAAPQLRNRITCPDDAEGEVIYWILKFLDEKKCPTKLISPIVRNVLVEILNDARFKETNGLRALATSIVEDFCARLLNNVELNKIIDTATSSDLNDDLLSIPIRAVGASTNARRKMEDRTICIDEFHKVYDVMNSAKSSFYGVFDGHNGYAAAHYVASQLPFNISKTSNHTTDPVILLQKSFQLTDTSFISRGATSSGTTAVCALYRPEEKRLYLAWAGDSKAMLAKQHGRVKQLVTAHRPDLEREKNRVLSLQGYISQVAGVLRVNGTSNVTRSLGDARFKPILTGDPDCIVVDLDGKEEFLVMATDGLWDHAHETEIARTVYECIKEDCENLDLIPSRLIKQAQDGQSTDNISVVVIFFKHPSQIAKNCDKLKIMESEFDNIKEVEYYDYSRNFYPSGENTTSNNSHAVDSKQMRWTPNDNLNNIISDEVNQTTTTTTTTSATTNNGQFDDNLLLNSSDNIDLNQKLSTSPHLAADNVGSGVAVANIIDDNSLHHASTLENNGEEFLATGGGYDNKNGKLQTPTTASEFDDDDDENNQPQLQNQQQQKILLEKNHLPQQMVDVDGDYGPETCVDVTDDVVMMTENSADTNNLSEQSTLSHSKDTLPSSDNCNPFDNKNALDMEETNEFHAAAVAGGMDVHLQQQLDDANKATPLLSPEVEDLPLSSDGHMHYTNEGYQQSPLDEMMPDQKQFEDEFMQSNGHLSPSQHEEIKDIEMEKAEKEDELEIDVLNKLANAQNLEEDAVEDEDLLHCQNEENAAQDMSLSNQKPELVENFFSHPMESQLEHQEKEVLCNSMHNDNDENDFRLKDEEEILEKHVVQSEEFAIKESALDLSQKDQLQHSVHNLEVDILEEKPILTGNYMVYDDSPTELEQANEFADEEKQDKEEFPEKEDKMEEKLSFVEQKSTPSEEIELEEENCIHLEEDVRPSDYLAMLERQKEELQQQQQQNQQELGQLDEGFEKEVQFEQDETAVIKSEVNEKDKEHENSMFDDDNKICDEMMEKQQTVDEQELAEKEFEKTPYEVEEFEKLAELQKQLQQPEEAEFLDNNKLEAEVASMIEEQISLIEDSIVQPEKQCFEEPEKLHDNLELEKNESTLTFEEIEKQLEMEHSDKPPFDNVVEDIQDELENKNIHDLDDVQEIHEEIEKQLEENSEKEQEDLKIPTEHDEETTQSLDELQVIDELEKQLEEDTEKQQIDDLKTPEFDAVEEAQPVLEKKLQDSVEDLNESGHLEEHSFEEVEKQLEENTEKQYHDSDTLPIDLKESEEPEAEQEIAHIDTNNKQDEQEDSCLGDIDKQVQDLAEFVEDLENKHFEDLKLDEAAKLFGECTEEQLKRVEEQVLDINAVPLERAEKVSHLFAEPDIDPENMVEVEEPIIVKEQVPIKASGLPVSGQEPSAVQPIHDSCDESEDDEWKYTKEGQGEKQLGLQGDTVVEEELPQELQDAGVTFSINERKASGNILQQQISINTSNLIESINDTFEGLSQNITELADQATAAVTENKEEKLEQGIQNLNLSQSSTREKLDNIEDDEELSAAEMNSRLNPEAKEFVPTFSPPATGAAKENGFAGNNPSAIPSHFRDELIAQSPRKGRESDMEDIKIPAENEFDEEIAHKPHELAEEEAIVAAEPTANGGGELFQEMNWKEAMHGSEKEEGPLADDSPLTEGSCEAVDNQMQFSAPPNVCELSAPVDLDNAGMKESIYIENNTSNDDLNHVQILPVEEIESGDSMERANDVISKEDVQELLTLASEEKIETKIEEEDIEQKMEKLLLSHDQELTKDVDMENVAINGVEMAPESLVAVSEPVVEQARSQPQEPSAPVEEASAAAVPVAEEAHEGLSLGGAAAVVAATAVATVAAAAATTAAVKKAEDEKNQKNLKKTSSATKSKVPDTKKPAVGSAAAKTSTTSTTAAKRTLADKPKPAAASSLAAKKPVSSTVASAAARPRAAPAKPTTTASTTDKKTTTSTTSTVKSRIDAKPPTTLANRKPLSSSATKTTTTSKSGDETKSSSSTVKSSTIGKSTLASKPLVARNSATNTTTKPRPATATSAATTNGTATTKTASAAKPTTLAPKSAGAAKPSTTSPRGTLTSTLRKTEAVKSPTKTTSSTITSRISTNGVTKSTTTTRTTTTKTTPSSAGSTTTRTTTSRLSVTGTTTGSTTPASKTTTNNNLASRKSTPLKKPTTNSSTTPTARKSIGSKLNSPATKPTTKDSSTPKPITNPAKKLNQINSIKAEQEDELKKAADVAAVAAVIEEPKLNGNASPDDAQLSSPEVAAPPSHPLIEMETV